LKSSASISPCEILPQLEYFGASIQKNLILNTIIKYLNNQPGVRPLNFNANLIFYVNPVFVCQLKGENDHQRNRGIICMGIMKHISKKRTEYAQMDEISALVYHFYVYP
jgi:hypothetical protein